MRPEQVREINPLDVEAEIREYLKKWNLKMCEEDIESLTCRIVDLRENDYGWDLRDYIE